MKFTPQLIREVSEFQRVRPRFEAAPVVSFDLETTSLEDHTVWGVGLAFPPADEDGTGLAVYFGCEDDCELDFAEHLKPFLETLFADTDREIVGQNLYFDFMVCRNNHFEVLPHRLFDTIIASWMVGNEHRTHRLEHIAKRFLKKDLLKDLMKIRKIKADNPTFYWQQMIRYGTEDVITPLELRDVMIPIILGRDLKKQFLDLEMPMIHVTSELQMAGIPIDVEHLKAIEPGIQNNVDVAKAEIFAIIGYEFNMNSPIQLSKALFEDYELPVLPGMEKTKQDAWPTNAGVMKNLQLAYPGDPIMQNVLTYRHNEKLLSTYIRKMILLAEADPEHRIRTNWRITGTTTGRYSTRKPINAQNMPRDKGLVRKAIIARPGFSLVACDYSQIELRLMAHFSGDPVMVQAYLNGEDLHRRTAAFILGVDEKDVDKTQRQVAKPVNFGFLYGMSARRFKDYAYHDYGVRVTSEEAEGFRDDYFKLYRGVVGYHDYMRDFVRDNKYALNFIGERRNLPKARSRDNYERWQAWSEGVNYTIQGCLGGGTRIMVERRGFVRLDSVLGAVKVWDGEQFVRAMVVSSGKKRKVIVRFKNGQKIVCSPDHPFLVVNSRGNEYFKSPRQMLDIRSAIRVRITRSVEAAGFVDELKLPNGFLKKHRFNGVASNGKKVGFEAISDSFDIGVILGRLSSDGTISKVDKNCGWLVADHERGITDWLRERLERIGRVRSFVHSRIDRKPLEWLYIDSVYLARQAKALAIKTRIHDVIFASRSMLQGFLCGLFDGDGGISGGSVVLTFGQGWKFRDFAEDVQRALALFAIRSRVRSYAGDRTVVQISSMDLPVFASEIGFLNPLKQEKLERLASMPTGKWRKKRGGVLCPKIQGFTQAVKEIEFTDEYIEMFDVVNSETGRFMADGFVVHNSAAALIKLAMRNIYRKLIRPYGEKVSRRYGRVMTCWGAPSLAHEVRLIMQVHDELVYEVRNEITKPFAKWLIHMMETAVPADQFRVPIIAESGIGRTLEDSK